MKATDRLRALLDERGVEWEDSESYGADAVTRFRVNDVWLRYVDYEDYQWIDYHEDEPLTPEQAVEATLGRGTCRMTRVENEERILCGWVECSECGPVYPPAAEGIQDAIRFCPYCGRKVVK